jgi:tetratricopeptide (TPR) repeat protein
MKKTYEQPEINECFTFYEMGRYEKAIEIGLLAVEKYPENPAVYYCLGLAYFASGILKLALENMKKAESLTNNKEDLMDICNQIGLILKEMGSLDKALLYFSRSLSLAKDLGDIDMQATLINNIGEIYMEKGELDKALSYYEEFLNLSINEKEKEKAYFWIARICVEKSKYQTGKRSKNQNLYKAVEYFQKAIEIAEKYGDLLNASIDKLFLGDTYRIMKDYENAEQYLLEGLKGVERVNNVYWVAMGYWYLGKLYDDKVVGPTKVREYYVRAYELFDFIGAEKEAQAVLKKIEEIDDYLEYLRMRYGR